jgi:FlaA1/EpsC-like NDP-sugar epimerase
VVPLFRKQIEEGGPVTVTHPKVVRYFMTIREAVQLVIQAAAYGKGGEIFVLDMGRPIKILDLARETIKLAGLEVNKDIGIQFIGLRPGEKLFEELLTTNENLRATAHKKIFIAPAEQIDEEKLNRDIGDLEQLARRLDTSGIREKLKEMVPTYQPATNNHKITEGA